MANYWENSCSFGLRYVSWYKCLIVSLVFSHLGFWSGNLFLIAPFPDLCLLVPFHLIGQAVSELKIFENGRRRTDDGRDHGHPISPPCRPNDSGKLKLGLAAFLNASRLR